MFKEEKVCPEEDHFCSQKACPFCLNKGLLCFCFLLQRSLNFEDSAHWQIHLTKHFEQVMWFCNCVIVFCCLYILFWKIYLSFWKYLFWSEKCAKTRGKNCAISSVINAQFFFPLQHTFFLQLHVLVTAR